MDADYNLRRAIEFREKETRRPVDLCDGRSSFEEVAQELKNSLVEWPHHTVYLLDVFNWNLPRLVSHDGTFRKPKVYLLLEVTVKGNLVLDWYPDKPAQKYLHEHDFRYWGNYWHPDGGMPDNRILMIRNFQHFLYHKTAPHSVKYLVEAVREHIHDVIGILKRLVDVELMTDLYLEYTELHVPKGKNRWHVETQQLASCRILSVEEIAEIGNQRWLEKTFTEMGITVETFLKVYWEAGGKYSKFTKILKEKGANGVGEVTAKNIVERLKSNFQELYRAHTPNDAAPDQKIEGILNFPGRKKK